MRAVVDANVLLSGLLWHGAPHALLEQVRAGRLALLSSPTLLAELAEVVDRPKFRDRINRSGINPASILAELRQLAEIIDPPPLPAPVSRDPDDDAVLALATAARADLTISDDADLLTRARPNPDRRCRHRPPRNLRISYDRRQQNPI